jgi:hypothetical protein
MRLTGLHVLLTYGCVYECDHCFVWGRCASDGVFTLDHLDVVIEQALQLGTVRDVFFEGGETFVYYPALITAVRRASRSFRTTIVTNGYWATSLDDACTWLGRLAEAGLHRVEFILLHATGAARDWMEHPGIMASEILGLESVVQTVDAPWRATAPSGAAADSVNELDGGLGDSWAAAPRQLWSTYTDCPYQDLANPEQAHVDPAGNIHLCEGLVIGNLFQSSLPAIVAGYQPEADPLIGPLLAGGPAELVGRYHLPHEDFYLDACQLCLGSRDLLRARLPEGMGRPGANGRGQAIEQGST